MRMNKKILTTLGFVAFVLAGCTGQFETSYEEPLNASEARGWNVQSVDVVIPDELTVSNRNVYAPNADIVWHGDPAGNRRAQVRQILTDGVSKGASALHGKRPVRLAVQLREFHGVTPLALTKAPGAVHNISYVTQVFDLRTGEAITDPQLIRADLPANVGVSAVIAAQAGDTQKSRITEHLAAVTKGWLGIGPDQRRGFSGFGR